MENDIDLLPESLKKMSLSDQEIVLPLKEALMALEILKENTLTILGCEGWAKYNNGKLGHVPYAMAGTLKMRPTDTWQSYVEWTNTFVKDLFIADQKQWESDHTNKEKDYELHFCIVSCSEEQYNK